MNNENDDEWLECGSIYFQDIEFEIRLPFSSKNLYLMVERKKFLMLHDEYTKRFIIKPINELDGQKKKKKKLMEWKKKSMIFFFF